MGLTTIVMVCRTRAPFVPASKFVLRAFAVTPVRGMNVRGRENTATVNSTSAERSVTARIVRGPKSAIRTPERVKTAARVSYAPPESSASMVDVSLEIVQPMAVPRVRPV